MRTNLIFKRQVTENGETKVVTRIVTVDVPSINSSEGWLLSGHTDVVEVVPQCDVTVLSDTVNDVFSCEPAEEVKAKLDNIQSKKFQVNIDGTAKLVRSKGLIKIVARRGKKTYNETSPDSVCIDDSIKDRFFNDCKLYYGVRDVVYQFSSVVSPIKYNFWDTFMKKEYDRQHKLYNKNPVNT